MDDLSITAFIKSCEREIADQSSTLDKAEIDACIRQYKSYTVAVAKVAELVSFSISIGITSVYYYYQNAQTTLCSC